MKPDGRRRVGLRRQEQLLLDFRRWGYDVRGWTPGTRDKYLRRVRVAEKWLAETRGTSVFWTTPKDLRAFLFSISGSARNRNNVRQALIAFYDFLVDVEVRDDNPASALPRLPEPDPLPKPITMDEAKRMIRAAKVYGPFWHVMILVFLYTGFRRANVIALQWTEFDSDMTWWHGHIKPRGKDHRIPVHSELRKALIGWRVQCGDPRWVFPSPRNNGRHISGAWVNEKVREIGEFAGIDIHPHIFRHTTATRMLKQTRDIRGTQKFMGHASINSTVLYAAVDDPHLEEVTETLDFGR